MKVFFVHRTARRLTMPCAVVICVLLAGFGSAWAGNKARVQIGFVGAPPPGFQNVLLNVIAVRINPHVHAGPGSGKWQHIPAPPGIGGANQLSELQIDLNTSQNVPELFNSANVRPDTYRIAELTLDSSNPGSLVTNCPSSPPVGGNSADGCITYPIQLNPSNSLTLQTPEGTAPLLPTSRGVLSTLVIQVAMSITKAPTSPGQPYTVNVTLSALPNSVLGTITGKVDVGTGSGSGNSPSGKVRKLTVTALQVGTSTPVASTPVTNGKQFTLALPAAGGDNASESGFGTLYDLAVAGGAATYEATRLQPLYPGTSITVSPTFSVRGNQTLGNISGQITDGCVATKPIIGATLQLLIPPDSNSGADCMTNPDQCVTVATANTDNAGDFPLPGTVTTPPAFGNVPTLGKNANPNYYVMEVTAPGYNPLMVQAIPGAGSNKKGGGTCSVDSGATYKACNLQMSTGYITGGFPIVPPIPGQNTLVQVFAEDHDSLNIESALPMPVTVTNSNNGVVGYTLNVPMENSNLVPIDAFDLFASTIDLYQGVVDPYQGHNIVAISDVPVPAACATVTAPTPSSADPTDTGRVIGCVGHGSIVGTVQNPNLGTSITLEKLDPDGPSMDNEVQIANSLVQNQAPNPAPNNYGFCAPADTYQLEEYQLAVPDPDATPLSMPTPAPVEDTAVTVTIPPPPSAGGPTPTPTPPIKCPTTCSNPGGTCPGICNTVIQAMPPAFTETPTATMTPAP